jgi:hypothetical protein
MIGVKVVVETFSVLPPLPRTVRMGSFAFFRGKEKLSKHVLKTKGRGIPLPSFLLVY